MSSSRSSPSREASSPSLLDGAGSARKLADQTPPRRYQMIQIDTGSCSRKLDEENDQDQSTEATNINTAKEDYTPILSLLSRLKQDASRTVDDEEVKVVTSGLEDSEPSSSSFRGFPIPGSVCETASSGKFSHEMTVRNKSEELADSDLSLSLGIGRGKRPNPYGYEAPFAFATQSASLPSEIMPMQLGQQMHFQQFSDDDDRKTANKRLKPMESSVAQLTIFYGGSVHIYNDVTMDKARAIMLLAETVKACPPLTNQSVESQFRTQSQSSNPSQPIAHQSTSSSAQLETPPQSTPEVGRSAYSAMSKTISGLNPPVKVSYTALPQARRISLQRFLQKRTERSRELSPFAAPLKNNESTSTPPISVPSSPSASGSRAPSPAP